MRHFTCVKDIGPLDCAIAGALEIKKNRFAWPHLGRQKTALLIFFDHSLRTRLSTQKAAQNLGMQVIVLNIARDAWNIETESGTIMNGDKSEHIVEAISVMGCYADIIGVRSFARFQSKADDYGEKILRQFIQYARVPVVSLEAATRHPLQSFADHITIEEYKRCDKPVVVLSWAPHPKALPQAVANSFVEWMVAAGYRVRICHPPGYELEPAFTRGAEIYYSQEEAFAGAHFIYAKNWSACSDAHYGQVLRSDRDWMIDSRKMALTDRGYFMHCLPIRRNMIVSDEVMDSPASIVIPEAANREISAQAVLKRILEDNF